MEGTDDLTVIQEEGSADLEKLITILKSQALRHQLLLTRRIHLLYMDAAGAPVHMTLERGLAPNEHEIPERMQ